MDLSHIIASFPPGTTFIIAHTPAGAATAQGGALSDGETTVVAALGAEAEDGGRAGQTPMEVVQAVEARVGPDTPVKISDWADHLAATGVSARELCRARRLGALPDECLGQVVESGSGRENRARVVSPRAMRDYVEARERGDRDPNAAPSWWAAVRRVR